MADMDDCWHCRPEQAAAATIEDRWLPGQCNKNHPPRYLDIYQDMPMDY